MRSLTRPLLFLALLGSSAALAQSNVRLSYEFATPTGNTKDFVDRFSSRGAHLDISVELSYAFNLELSAGLNSFNAVKQGVLATTDGDVSGKQFRYLNVIPLMGGFAFHIPLGHGSRLWAGVNGGAAYFDRVLNRLTFPGALFLAAVAVAPSIFIAHFHFNQNTYRALGGTSVLIVVGVALQTMRQMESQMVMRHYEGFLR